MACNAKERIAVFLTLALTVFFVMPTGCVSTAGKLRWAEQLYKNGQYLASKGKEEAAVEKFEKSLKLSREIGFSAGIAHNLNELAIYHASRKDYEKARALLFEAIAIYREEGMAPEVSKAMNNVANTYMREGKIGKTFEQYNELLDWDRQTGNLLGEAITLYNMGSLYERYIGDKKKASERYVIALDYFTQLDNVQYIKIVEQGLIRVGKY